VNYFIRSIVHQVDPLYQQTFIIQKILDRIFLEIVAVMTLTRFTRQYVLQILEEIIVISLLHVGRTLRIIDTNCVQRKPQRWTPKFRIHFTFPTVFFQPKHVPPIKTKTKGII
jgi:hypothetical protein